MTNAILDATTEKWYNTSISKTEGSSLMMKKVFGSKAFSAAGIGIILLSLVGLILLGVHFFIGWALIRPADAIYTGTYSIDGGAWSPIEENGRIPGSFQTLICRWKLPEYSLEVFDNLNISSKNVWYELTDSSGQILVEHSFTDKQTLLDNFYDSYVKTAEALGQTEKNPSDPLLDKAYFDANYPIGDAPYMYMSDTPGYCTQVTSISELVSKAGLTDDSTLVLTIHNPYPNARMRFSDCINLSLSSDNGYYIEFFGDALPPLCLFLLVCFFGIFLFPIAGFILGKVDFRYMTFGLLCFLWGLFMIGQRVSKYLNLWIYDPTICLAILTLLNYALAAAILFYLKSNLKERLTRTITGVTTAVYLVVVIIAAALHFSCTIDLYATSINLFVVTAVCTLIPVVLLLIERRRQDAAMKKRSRRLLIALIPLAVSILLDTVNHYICFTTMHFSYFGLTIIMFYQIVRMILDLRQQYKEAIRFQQMQKELYEARVSVMVSQIQPHFMYNALTSIAMMCSIDPDTAQEATVTFAKYLRGNMDSLKQATPVPFEQELEHLKKYIYIEKLRFQNKLAIDYDIQTTDFVLPMLSIQPLVENAVKHGVGMKKKGGTVTIATRETEDAFEVVISDDGVGFDVNAERPDDGRSHVGMENTRQRLKELCDGEVVIESTIDVGTTAKVILPKSGQPAGEETEE